MTNLINLEDYKISENIQNTKDDARLTMIIESVSQLVKTWGRRTSPKFKSKSITISR